MSHTRDAGTTSKEGTTVAVREFRQMFAEGRSFSGNERNCAFLNTTAATAGVDSFADVSSVSGFDFADDGRAIALVDWDEDGDLDLWISNRNAPQLRFLRNDHPRDNHHLALRLQGNGTSTPRDAIGSRVAVQLNGDQRPLITTLRAGEGFLAQSSKWLHLGLGKADNIAEASVRWSDGSSETFTGLAADRRYRLVQGSGRAVEVPTRRSQGQASQIAASTPTPLKPAGTAKIACLALLDIPNLLYLERPFGGQEIIETGGGKPILINLWSSSCGPCIKELGELKERAPELEAAGIQVVALSVDSVRGDQEEIDAAQALLTRLELPFTTGYADWKLIFFLQSVHNSLSASGRLLPVPTSFLLDEQGRLSVIYKGSVGVDEILADQEHARRTLSERFAHMFSFGGSVIDHPRVEEIIAGSEATTIFRFAQELEASQRNGSAIAQYRKLLQHVPDHVVAHYSAGNLLVREERIDEGLPHFKKALAIDPDFGAAQYRLGVAYILQDRLDDALPHLVRATELLADNSQVFAALGSVYEKLDRYDEAIAALEAAQQLAPEDKNVEQMLQRVRQHGK